MFSGEKLLTLVIILVIVLISMVLHELAHGWVAYLLGDDTAKEDGRLTLNPLKHLDPVLSFLIPILMFFSGGPIFGGAKPVPVNSRNLKHGAWGMALVAVAGPLTNFLIAIIAFFIGYFTGVLSFSATGVLQYAPNLGGLIVLEVLLVNLGFGIFNLIPIPPLDGSRVLYAIAPDGVREVMSKMEQLGLVIVFAIIILFPNIISVVLGGAMDGILAFLKFIVGG